MLETFAMQVSPPAGNAFNRFSNLLHKPTGLCERVRKAGGAMNKVLYTIPQVADMTNLSKSTIYREITANRLQPIMVRSKMRIDNDALDAYIQLCKKKQSEPSLTGGQDDQ